ncbi:MAG: efflux RND transporter periplasmic adaptor subunit [Proteobacteria bacterium]|nr:efflux RND transporter periplasmic adaptor subunit [Pseudomonadota bacterium]
MRAPCGSGFTLLVLALLTGCGAGESAPQKPAAASAPPSGVALSPEQVQALGIRTEAARAADYEASATGFGVIVSLETFAQAYAEVATASAAAAQSTAALARARSLASGEDAAVSQEVLDNAASKSAADQAALALALRKSEAVFGVHTPWRSAADLKRVLDRLAQGHTVLARVTFPLGALPQGQATEITLARIGRRAQGWHTRVTWPAPADPALPGRGFFALLDGSDLLQGEHVMATTAVGGHLSGVWVPQAALLLSEGDSWVYVGSAGGPYVRVRVEPNRPDAGGYVVASGTGIAPGQPVVVSGAGLLLSRELNPAGSGGG